MALDPSRTVAELRELQELTGDENGAQRVAWTETWERGREWLQEKIAPTGAEHEVDEAGNQWFTLRGESERTLLIGGHMDSVPNGGWLDGWLDVPAVRRRWTTVVSRSPGLRSSSSRPERSQSGSAAAQSAPWAASSRSRGSSPRWSRRPNPSSTSATSTRRSAPRC